MTNLDQIPADFRMAAALERIATALEQGILERLDDEQGMAGIAKGQVAAFDDPYPAELDADLPPVRPQMADECPIHHAPWKTVPAGVSKKTGNAYQAFRACSVAGCDQRPRL